MLFLPELIPFDARSYCLRRNQKGRKCRTKMGALARSRRSLVNAHRATKPWLFATSLSENVAEREIVASYATRMQIEESFRDLTCHRNGLDLYHNGTYKRSRMKMLVLIGAAFSGTIYFIKTALILQSRNAHRKWFPRSCDVNYSSGF